jgi:ATP-binding cassette subfamily C protein
MLQMRWPKAKFLGTLLNILSRKQKIRILQLLFLQFLSGILELIGILFVGIISITSLAILNSNSIPNYPPNLSKLLSFLNLETLNSRNVIFFAAVTTVIFFAIKNLFILWMGNYLQRYLSQIAAEKSVELFDSSFQQNQINYSIKDREESAYSATQGSVYAVMGLIGSLITLVAEGLGVTMIIIVLMIINIPITVLLVFIYLTYSLLMSKYFGHKVSSNARSFQASNEDSRILFKDLQNVQRELFVSGKVAGYRYKFLQLRTDASAAYGKIIFYQSIPRILLDFLVILSVFLIASFAVLTSDIRGAVTQIVVFLAAISRIAPSALRLQQAKLMARSSYSQSGNFFDLLNNKLISIAANKNDLSLKRFETFDIVFENVSFKHKGAGKPILNSLEFVVRQGEFVAIVGKSGAGKSTLLDLILGALNPSSGNIWINNVPPRDFIGSHPGFVSFVPQKVSLIHAPFLENLTFSFDSSVSSEVVDLIHQTNLEKFLTFDFQPNILNGDFFQGSGGEIQRIGLSRALITNPKLLVLDEPTSSQDQLNVDLFNKILKSLQSKNVTIILVAHNLNTMKNADRILFLDEDDGLVQGNFNTLSNALTSFQNLTKMRDS